MEGYIVEPALVKVEEAARLLAIGRSKTYEMIASGDLPVIRIGRSVRVPVAAIRRFVDQRMGEPVAAA